MSRLSSKKAILAAILFGIVSLVFAQFVLRPQVRRWRTHMEDVSIDSSVLSVRDFGAGRPTVVIANGMSCHMDSYYELQKALAKKTRVIAYDRPGIGQSTPNQEPRTLPYIVRDMKKLLSVQKAPPPYVMIGHSLGGHIIREYANRYPSEVAGLVFLDHPHEDWFHYIRKTWTEEEVDEYFQFWNPKKPADMNAAMEERLAYEENCDLIRGKQISPEMSVLMFTANNDGHYRKQSPGREEDRQAWGEMQAALLLGVKDAKHIIDWDTGHFVHKDKPEMVVNEIEAFIDRVREKKNIR